MAMRRPLLRLLLLLAAATTTATAFLLPPLSCRRPHPSGSISGRLADAPARAEAAAAAAAWEGDDGPSTTRLRQGVYIEHTDRYGMVYNSNYLLFLNRAIHRALGGQQRHAVLRLSNFRFKASARLGHDIEVEVTPKKDGALAVRGFWFGDGNPQDAARAAAGPLRVFETVIKEAEAPDQVFITAEVATLSLPRDRKAWSTVFSSSGVVMFIPDALTDVAAKPDKAMDTTVWPDELGVDGLLTPHAVLSMFERARSDALGGPDILEELMAEGCIFVVARLDGYQFDPSIPVEEGDEMRVLGRFRRKGASIVICDQVLTTKGGGMPGTIVAQTEVTLACISAEGGRMIAVPEKALASMNLHAGRK